MPLSNHARVIAGGLQVLGSSRLRAVEAIKDGHPVEVAVFAGENCRATWSADGVNSKAVLKTDPLRGESIQVRRLIHPAAIRADCVGGMVIAHDKQDVWTRLCCTTAKCCVQ